MPTYPTPGILWQFSLLASPSDDRAITVGSTNVLIDASTNLIPAIADCVLGNTFWFYIKTYMEEGTADEGLGSSITVTMDGDGYVHISNFGDGFYLFRTGLMANLGMAESQDGVYIDDGGEVAFLNHPRWMWHPRMVTQRDTGDQLRHVTMTSRTITGRPVEVVHTDDWYEREIRWQTVASCLIRNSRATSALFCQAGPKNTGDTHNTLESLINYVRNSETDSYNHPLVYVAENLAAEDGGFGGLSGPYYLDIEKSKCSGGVKDDEMLYTETAMESYMVQLHLRKQ